MTLKQRWADGARCRTSLAQGSVTTTTPYGPHPADFLSNVRNFKIIESTLREGEQFANAFFNLEVRLLP